MTGKLPKRNPRPGVDGYGRTPLHNAVIKLDLSESIKLIQTGADPSAQDDSDWSPLHFAAQSNAPELSKTLLEAGSKVDLRNSFGNTAFFRTVFSYKGSGSVIALLRASGADPLSTNSHGVSPLSLARSIANYDLAQYFTDLL